MSLLWCYCGGCFCPGGSCDAICRSCRLPTFSCPSPIRFSAWEIGRGGGKEERRPWGRSGGGDAPRGEQRAPRQAERDAQKVPEVLLARRSFDAVVPMLGWALDAAASRSHPNLCALKKVFMDKRMCFPKHFPPFAGAEQPWAAWISQGLSGEAGDVFRVYQQCSLTSACFLEVRSVLRAVMKQSFRIHSMSIQIKS